MVSWVWSQKILLIHHMARLEEGDLARMMLEEQLKYGWPGLSLEVASLCEQLGLEDPVRTKMNKNEYKKEVAKACKGHNFCVQSQTVSLVKYDRCKVTGNMSHLKLDM